MHATVLCIDCEHDELHGAMSFELGEHAIIQGKCPAGHDVRGVVQNPKRELLFELGMRALHDGYYREAVMNMASALESTYLTFARVVVRHLVGCPAPDDEAGLDAARERTAGLEKWLNRSEPQHGAFILAYTVLTGDPPDWRGKKTEKQVNRRNEVVHAGYIPTQAEARTYAEFAFDLILKLVTLLKTKAREALRQEDASEFGARAAKLGFGPVNTTFAVPTVLSVLDEQAPQTFAEAWEVYVNHHLPYQRLPELRDVARQEASGLSVEWDRDDEPSV